MNEDKKNPPQSLEADGGGILVARYPVRGDVRLCLDDSGQSQADSTTLDGPASPRASAASGPASGGECLPCLGSHNISGLSPDTVIELGTQAGLATFCRVTENGLTSGQKRSLFALRNNLEEHIDSIGVKHCAFVTVTAKGRFKTSKEFQEAVFRVLISCDTFKRYFGSWYRVFEPHKSGAWHAHLLAETFDDIWTGVDLDKLRLAIKTGTKDRALTARLYREFAPADHPLREIWRAMRRLSSVSKEIGRIQVEPIRSNAEGVGKYLSKYLQKGVMYRKAWSNGEKTRLWAKSKGAARRVSCQFAWNSDRAREWRGKLALVGEHFGVQYGEMKERFGPRWAYHFGQGIRALSLHQPFYGAFNAPALQELDFAAWRLDRVRDLDEWRETWRRTKEAQNRAKKESEESQERLINALKLNPLGVITDSG